MRTVRISVRVPADLRDQLLRDDMSISVAARRALEHYVSRQREQQSCFDLAEHLGIIGSVKRAPRDLSTNRRHFRGFGE